MFVEFNSYKNVTELKLPSVCLYIVLKSWELWLGVHQD